MNKVTRYQDLLDADHNALVAECKRIDNALARGVDPYAQTQEMPAVKPMVSWADIDAQVRAWAIRANCF